MHKSLRVESVTMEQLLSEPNHSKTYLQILGAATDAANNMGLLEENTPIEDQEIALLGCVSSHWDLRYVCDVLKSRRKMTYPKDWGSKIGKSGLYALVIEHIEKKITTSDFKKKFDEISSSL